MRRILLLVLLCAAVGCRPRATTPDAAEGSAAPEAAEAAEAAEAEPVADPTPTPTPEIVSAPDTGSVYDELVDGSGEAATEPLGAPRTARTNEHIRIQAMQPAQIRPNIQVQPQQVRPITPSAIQLRTQAQPSNAASAPE